MSNEERLTLNIYLEGLYQAMQIGDIVYEPKHSSELYNLINKLLEENQKYKEVIDKAKKLHNEFASKNSLLIFENNNLIDFMNNLINILKEVEHDS